MERTVISADSHVCEHPNTFIDRIDKKFLERAPRLVHDEKRGDVFLVDGSPNSVPLSLTSAAGKKPEELSATGAVFDKLHRGGWDPVARLGDQDVDGRAAVGPFDRHGFVFIQSEVPADVDLLAQCAALVR